jgi:plastocyanin
MLGMGGAAGAALALSRWPAWGEEAVEIAMTGRGGGAQVWFDPIGIRVEEGALVRWINREPGNVHTTTAYHPDNGGRPRRMPEGADPWDSGYLMPEGAFEVRLTVPGVYDYFCLPHEHAGMVGRIVVGEPAAGIGPGADGGVPEVALEAFPAIEEIMARGVVRRA